MKSYFLAASLFSSVVASQSKKPSITIEDNLQTLPVSIASSVVDDSSFSVFRHIDCKPVGAEISLSKNIKTKTWFVTTANGCGWGASLGPIWIIRQETKVSKLLYTGGYALIPSPTFHNGMADIVISAGSSAIDESKTYIFNGISYEKNVIK